MSTPDKNHVIDWLPAFVLDALTADEMQQVSSHLAECPSCQTELAHLQQVADELPLAVRQTSPPPELKRKLMQSILSRKEKPIRAADRAPRLPSLASIFRGYLPALGLALIIILAFGNVFLWRQLSITSQKAHTPMRVVSLRTTEYSAGAMGTLIMDPEGRYGTLIVDNLATLDPDKQYQVWLIKGTDRTNGGTFSVNTEGYASLQILAPMPLTQYDSIGVSIEPIGGSLDQTGPDVFRAYLAQ